MLLAGDDRTQASGARAEGYGLHPKEGSSSKRQEAQ